MRKLSLKNTVMTCSLVGIAMILPGCSANGQTAINPSTTHSSNSQESQLISKSLNAAYKGLRSTLKITEVKTVDQDEWVLFTLGKPVRYDGLAYLHKTDAGWKIEGKKIISWNDKKPIFVSSMGGHLAGNIPQSYLVVGGQVNSIQVTSVQVDFQGSSDVVMVNHDSPYYLLVKKGLNSTKDIQDIIGLGKSNKIIYTS
ncbi:hypothetical protein [Alicyclobacillus mengziensis]|uniref:Lipoprotein n=1 Tax=Alicyclobacillus mengziensis TaxID=2931921 RepID=A0A9X7Z8S5_9BACL|nr:hypothetical protein [Alicyclobacillus mengziensis]QSO48755.1 hypothetical protein JZ786_07285 [Alicyclobacillus mengziensis]